MTLVLAVLLAAAVARYRVLLVTRRPLLRPGGRRGPVVFASWEDTVIAVMAPRSGKTTVLSVPFVLSALGAVPRE